MRPNKSERDKFSKIIIEISENRRLETKFSVDHLEIIETNSDIQFGTPRYRIIQIFQKSRKLRNR